MQTYEEMSRDIKDTIARNVRILRACDDITQVDLGLRAGISRDLVSIFEAGSPHRDPKLSTLVRLAIALKVEVADLLKKPKRAGDT